ncbi:DUF1572 domain-containing protein [Robertkochia marina]|uniref:DUF1572 domain-containing protein n=1 Tax=Robertkochia marina TaxID=1227945 RepID=A0A4S3M2L0_9FLAO|nr:DUF1572 family protein [Robertkochia marina]THD69283.1 DUF1572 domain-containing protein [Robertkochia marina]TRZ47458.1 DUF1572 domain-containing protein [Robertkochia marina]
MPSSYLHSIVERFRFYKQLGEDALEQIPDNQLHWQVNETGNSVYVIVKHISGNMLSRFTDFLTSDGEKPWRERDKEFKVESENSDRASLMIRWEEGWQCLFKNIEPLVEADLERIVYIRKEPHTVVEALNRQLGHYAYHIGQIVLLAKMICGENWRSLSIPKGKSKEFNKGMFSKNDLKG